MAARSRFVAESKSHDKKDDGFAPSRTISRPFFGRWLSFRRRRVVLSLVALWLLYLFFKHIPTDVPSVAERYDPRYGRLHLGWPAKQPPQMRTAGGDDFVPDHAIKFYDLGPTLRDAAATRDATGHVLFAVFKVSSLRHLLPTACAFAQRNRTQVHVALMGRHYVDWEQVRAVNGIAGDGCAIHLHNALPDYAGKSSDARMEMSVRASLGHLYGALKMAAVFAGDAQYEDERFVRALQEKSRSLGVSVILLPPGATRALSWLAHMDASCLRGAADIQLDIIIQAPRESSAPLIRLLRSLRAADYSGWRRPRLTIELPATVDPFLSQYLATFQWPADGPGGSSQPVLRHRLDPRLLSPAQASLRTVESFYSVNPGRSHLLLLSPRMELSPDYFQLLMYTLLTYRYGARRTRIAERLAGFSLELPQLAPDSQTSAPWTASEAPAPMMLWQAPAANAVLYLGDRWREFHDFLSLRLLVDQDLVQKVPSAPALSQEHPAWLQAMLELMLARGYYLLYPTFLAREQAAAVTGHGELVQAPEEYLDREDRPDPAAAFSGAQALDALDEAQQSRLRETAVDSRSLVASLAQQVSHEEQDAPFVESFTVPARGFSGDSVAWEEMLVRAQTFAGDFARTVGKCTSHDTPRPDGSVGSLFCGHAGS